VQQAGFGPRSKSQKEATPASLLSHLEIQRRSKPRILRRAIVITYWAAESIRTALQPAEMQRRVLSRVATDDNF
jgi:hypothetical protein